MLQSLIAMIDCQNKSILCRAHLAIPSRESEESLLLQAEGDEATDADLERPGDAGGELEVGEVGGEAGAEHGVAPLTLLDLIQLGLSQSDLRQKSEVIQHSHWSRSLLDVEIFSCSCYVIILYLTWSVSD